MTVFCRILMMSTVLEHLLEVFSSLTPKGSEVIRGTKRKRSPSVDSRPHWVLEDTTEVSAKASPRAMAGRPSTASRWGGWPKKQQ